MVAKFKKFLKLNQASVHLPPSSDAHHCDVHAASPHPESMTAAAAAAASSTHTLRHPFLRIPRCSSATILSSSSASAYLLTTPYSASSTTPSAPSPTRRHNTRPRQRRTPPSSGSPRRSRQRPSFVRTASRPSTASLPPRLLPRPQSVSRRAPGLPSAYSPPCTPRRSLYPLLSSPTATLSRCFAGPVATGTHSSCSTK